MFSLKGNATSIGNKGTSIHFTGNGEGTSHICHCAQCHPSELKMEQNLNTSGSLGKRWVRLFKPFRY